LILVICYFWKKLQIHVFSRNQKLNLSKNPEKIFYNFAVFRDFGSVHFFILATFDSFLVIFHAGK